MTEQLLNQPLESAPAETTATTVETNPGDQVVSAAPTEELILGKFKTNDELIKAYSNLESMMGKKVTSLTPDEAKVLKELQGRPKSVDEYKLPEGTPEEVGAWFKDQAFKLGLSNNDAMELMHGYTDLLKRDSETQDADLIAYHENNIAILKTEFGAAFEQRVELAQQAALSIGGEDLVNVLGEAGLGTHPVVIKALANIGKSMKEDSIPTSQQSSRFGTTPEEAKRTIDSKMLDSEFRDAYFNARHPGHDAAVRTMEELFALTNGGK